KGRVPFRVARANSGKLAASASDLPLLVSPRQDPLDKPALWTGRVRARLREPARARPERAPFLSRALRAARRAAASGARSPRPHLRQVRPGALDTPRPLARRPRRRAGEAPGPGAPLPRRARGGRGRARLRQADRENFR